MTAVARMALDMVDFARTYVHKDGRQIQIRYEISRSHTTRTCNRHACAPHLLGLSHDVRFIQKYVLVCPAYVRTYEREADTLDASLSLSLCAICRVGMYTGNVTAAVIGKKMPHWCLVGDTVNVASRKCPHCYSACKQTREADRSQGILFRHAHHAVHCDTFCRHGDKLQAHARTCGLIHGQAAGRMP